MPRNKLTVVPFADPSTKFWPTFIAVEGVSEDGYPCTFARIFHNKHGRHNLVRVAGLEQFMAGSRSKSAVMRYAATVDPATTVKVFIDRGVVREVS